MKRTVLAAALALVLASASAQATVVWKGDYETGNLTQWDRVDGLASMLTVVQSPVHQGKYALRVELHQGQVSSSGTRNELELGGIALSEGMERWFAWSTLFPADFPSNNTWQVFTQWHHSGCCGSPPLEMDIIGETLQMTHNGDQALWTAPLVRGVWHDFVVHVKFSATSGFVELWYDGKKALDQTTVQTLNPGEFNYMKQGLYWNASITSVGVLYHDGTIMGTGLADVAPQLEPGFADAGTPPDAGPVADAGTPPITPPPPAVDAGTPAADAGQVAVDPDAGQGAADPDAGQVAVDPPQVLADAGVVPVAQAGFSNVGCSSTGATSLGAFGLLGMALFALRRTRRPRG